MFKKIEKSKGLYWVADTATFGKVGFKSLVSAIDYAYPASFLVACLAIPTAVSAVVIALMSVA